MTVGLSGQEAHPLTRGLGEGSTLLFGCILLAAGALASPTAAYTPGAPRVVFVRDTTGARSGFPTNQGLHVHLSAEQAATTLWGLAPSVVSTEDYTAWAHLPDWEEQRQVPAAALLRAVKKAAGLSGRDLGRLLGVSHPTVAAMLEGRASARSREALAKIPALHDVVQRLTPLAASPQALRTALGVAGADGRTGYELLVHGQHADAYRAALGALRPRRPGLLTTRPGVRVERGTADPTLITPEGT